ncbi:unnamed protein product [Arabis nemorensis]|uniref:Uncharacterized protein n=1 Tax=Arabis nemorensis TaxID=586526 RepID=A0A565AKD3_9BRAS|nr:unnamed protein product [Arabis nemorensis]
MGRVDRIDLPRPPRRPRFQELRKLEAELKAMDSEMSNTATSTVSYEIMNHGIPCALRAGDKESFIKRISNDGMIIQQRVDCQGNSILHLAAASGHVHIVEYIVSTFKDLLQVKNVMGETVFHVAARSGNLSVVEYLLKCTMACPLDSAKTKSENGDTALHAALKGKYADVALYLLGVRHDVSFDKNNDQTTLDMALGSAGSPNGSQSILLSTSHRRRRSNRQNTETTKDDGIKILKWTVTIVATVTIVMCCTCTKVYISSAPDLSITGLVKTAVFAVFMLCNSVPILASVETMIDIIRARHLNDVLFVRRANLLAMALVIITFVSMFVAFMVGVGLVLILRLWHSFS